MTFNTNEHSDEKLLQLIIAGNRDAFAILVKRHVTKFYQTAFVIVKSKSDAEDIVQECFLKLWQNPHNWDETKGVKFTTWFARVIANKCYDFFRKHKEDQLTEDFDIADNQASALQILENNYNHELLSAAFAALSYKQQTAITLSFFENRKNIESAQMMNLSLKAFQSLLMRSKESLKQNFKKLS